MTNASMTSGRSWLVGCILLLHGLMLGWLATRHSPAIGEIPALASGVWHWKSGDFVPFRVNPPLVRMVAALPVLAFGAETDWSGVSDHLTDRCEFRIGTDFISANPDAAVDLFIFARWACIPFAILGAIICYLWASELYGPRAGLASLALWCFSPEVLAQAQLITADAPAASFGVLAGYCFSRWVREARRGSAITAGVSLGLALLVKTTWLILFVIWPLLWCLIRFQARSSTESKAKCLGPPPSLLQLVVVLVIGIAVLNIGYTFDGSGIPLGEYQFISDSLGGNVPPAVRFQEGGNRFRDSWVGAVPVPLPKDFLLGIDRQKRDFEAGEFSYFNGEWRTKGRWYYYLFTFAMSVPDGFLLMLGIALFRMTIRSDPRIRRDAFILLVPAIAVFILVSSQTGLNSHFRYALPAFPFLFVYAAGSVTRTISTSCRFLPLIAICALVTTIIDSGRSFPHYRGYYNIISGASDRLPPVLLGSKLDWGQDLLLLKWWHDALPIPEPMTFAGDHAAAPQAVGLQFPEPPPDPNWASSREHVRLGALGPQPGLHAVSVNRLYSRDHQFEYFKSMKPVAKIGDSIFVYRIHPRPR